MSAVVVAAYWSTCSRCRRSDPRRNRVRADERPGAAGASRSATSTADPGAVVLRPIGCRKRRDQVIPVCEPRCSLSRHRGVFGERRRPFGESGMCHVRAPLVLVSAHRAPTGMIVSRCEHDARILRTQIRRALPRLPVSVRPGARSGRSPGPLGRNAGAPSRYRVVRRSAPGRFCAPCAAPGPPDRLRCATVASAIVVRTGVPRTHVPRTGVRRTNVRRTDVRRTDVRERRLAGIRVPPTPTPNQRRVRAPRGVVVGFGV